MISPAVKAALISLMLPLCAEVLSGCHEVQTPSPPTAAAPSPPPPPPPAPTNPARPTAPRPVAPIPMVPTRGFLAQGAAPNAAYGAVGFVLFTSKPSDPSKARYVAACEAYMARLEPNAAYSAYNPSHVMPTYWPLTTMPIPQTCDQLIDRYDYARATPLLSLVGRLASTGPVLAAWDTSPESRDAPKHQITLDLSNFSDEDMERAFGIWMQQLARDPSLWQQGFDAVRIKESFRNLIERYGEEIVQVVDKSA